MTPDALEEHIEEPAWQDGPSGWTESSDNEEPTFDEEGEYTGKFTSYAVPTKPDPPTTVQRERQEAWGRPISPFPYPTDRTSRWSSPLTPAETQEDSQTETQESGKEPGKQPALEVADLTLTPHDAEGEQFFGSDQNAAQEGATTSSNAAAVRQVLVPADIPPMFNFDGMSSPDHSYETPLRPPKDKPVPFITFFPKKSSIAGSSKTPKIRFPPPQRSFIFNSPARNVADLERDEESFVDRELSQAPEDDNEDNKVNELSQRVPELLQFEASEEDTEGEDEDVIDLGVIKISSEDPMAAAKAAAILKLVRGVNLFVVKSLLMTWCSTITTSSNARADGTSLRLGSRKRHCTSAPQEDRGKTLSPGPSVLWPCPNLLEKQKPSWRSRSLEASDL